MRKIFFLLFITSYNFDEAQPIAKTHNKRLTMTILLSWAWERVGRWKKKEYKENEFFFCQCCEVTLLIENEREINRKRVKMMSGKNWMKIPWKSFLKINYFIFLDVKNWDKVNLSNYRSSSSSSSFFFSGFLNSCFLLPNFWVVFLSVWYRTNSLSFELDFSKCLFFSRSLCDKAWDNVVARNFLLVLAFGSLIAEPKVSRFTLWKFAVRSISSRAFLINKKLIIVF